MSEQMADPARVRHRLAALGPALFSAVLAIALYAVTINANYIFDDTGILLNDTRLTDPSRWGQYWTQPYHDGVDNLYRPLTSMSYALQWALHGLDRPWGFRIVNVLLHAGVCAVVAELARRLSGMSAAIIAGLLFAAHPIHVEAVAMIVGRAELLCALGTIGGMLLMLHRPITLARVFAIVGCFLVALLTKEQGMLFPLLLAFLAIGIWIHARRSGQGINLTRRERRVLPWLILTLCWILAVYIYLREHVLPLKFWWDRSFLDWTINPMIRSEGLDRALMPLVLLGRYVQLLVAPWRLSIDYGGSVIGWTVNFSDPYLYLGILAIAVWMIAMIVAWRMRDGVAMFALLALAATYGIAGNIVTLIGTNFGERLMYMPSIFLILLIGHWLVRLPRPAVVAIAGIALILASVRTVTYAARWTDRLAFYEYSLEQQPRSIRIHMLLIAELQSRGRLEEAEQLAALGREVEPQYWDIWVQSALIAMDLGKYDEAEQYLTRAMEISPRMNIAGLREELAQRRAAAEEKR